MTFVPENQEELEVVETPSDEKMFRKYVAMVNPNPDATFQFFTLRLRRAFRVTARRSIKTSTELGFELPITLARYTSSHEVCDSGLIRGFYVRVSGGSPKEYIERFWKAKLSFLLDGERLIDQVPIRKLLSMKEIVFQNPGKEKMLDLFRAYGVRHAESFLDSGLSDAIDDAIDVDEDDFLGFMAPNESAFRVELEGVPGGCGIVVLEVGWNLPEYTTKGFPSGKDMGAL